MYTCEVYGRVAKQTANKQLVFYGVLHREVAVVCSFVPRPSLRGEPSIFSHVSDIRGRKDFIVRRQAQL